MKCKNSADYTFLTAEGKARARRQDLAQTAGTGEVVPAGQVHPRQGNHRQPSQPQPRSGRRHRRRNQRRTGAEESRRWLRNGKQKSRIREEVD